MRTVRLHRYGNPGTFRLDDVPEPRPGAGELLIRAEAIGMTLPAVRQARGEGGRLPLPRGLGGEVAGTVAAVGPEVEGYRAGDRVVGLAFADAYADLVVVPAVMAGHIPDHADFVQAVALVRSGHVALAALNAAGLHLTGGELWTTPKNCRTRVLYSDPTQTGAGAGGGAATDDLRPERSLDLGPGPAVLITGAASGVGHLAVRLAKLCGAERVVAAVGSRDKAAFLLTAAAEDAAECAAAGADDVVVYGDASWGEPVDVVLDAIGGDVLPAALRAVRPGGTLVFFGSGGGTIPAHDLLAGSKTVTGLAMATFARTRPELYREHEKLLWRLHEAGLLRPAIHAEIPLADATEAFRIVGDRANLGKVVIRP